MRFSTLLSLPLFALGACSNATDATVTTTTSPFYTITTDIKDSSSVPAGSVLLVQAHVTHAGLRAPSPAITWTVLAGHGLLSAATSVGDTLGNSSVLWTLGDTAGINTLVIATGSGADTLHVKGIVGTATVLKSVSADSVSVARNATSTLQVRASDRVGNAAPATSIAWSTTGGALSATTTTTDATGLAQVTFTAPNASGVYLVTATLPGQATRTFQIAVP